MNLKRLGLKYFLTGKKSLTQKRARGGGHAMRKNSSRMDRIPRRLSSMSEDEKIGKALLKSIKADPWK